MEDGSRMLVNLPLGVLVAMSVVMVGAWAFGLRTRNGGWTDVFWTFGSGAALVGAALWPLGGEAPHARQWLVAGLAALWAIRLGGFLAPRVAAHEDPRYAQFRKDWGKDYPRNMLFVTFPQAPATALLSLSVIPAAHAAGPLGFRDAIAVAILLAAIAGEGLADNQMKAFRADSANKGKVCDTGLWAWSRHPNYFFDWLGWLAYPVIALDPGRPESWLSLAGPAAIYLVLRYLTGVPPLEASMRASRGASFDAYRERTSAFLLLPPKRAQP
jgi:steroid 5-alpha reductase family enzyme